jgi:hypothetical protein
MTSAVKTSKNATVRQCYGAINIVDTVVHQGISVILRTGTLCFTRFHGCNLDNE